MSLRAVRYIEQDRVSRPRQESVQRLATAVGLVLPDQRVAGGLGIEVLGPLVVHRRHRQLDAGPAKQRVLLALLAVQPNQPVLKDEIVDVLWGDEPPASHGNLVHTYVARLRKALTVRGSDKSGINAVRGGYQLEIEPNQLDLLRFDELVHRAARAVEDPALAADLLAEALGCWRGPVLADLPQRVREHPATRAVAQRRIDAALDHADLGIALGRYDEVVAQLRRVTALEPTHEALHSRFMTALGASGDQVGALDVYATLRRRLDEELGIEPGREARDAYVRVLRGEAGKAAEEPPPAVHGVNQLPRGIDDFTGRAAEIDHLLATVSPDAHTVAISAIDGMAGVGKTSLAIQVGWRLREQYPDGQLFIDLHGHTPTHESLEPKEALGRLLRALDADCAHVPEDVDDCVSRWRTALMNRKVLVVLDNAANAEQVRPLLPNSAGCLAIVTSRHRLAGLEGVQVLSVDVLPEPEAVALFSRIVGDDRVTRDLDAVHETVRLCGRLPLAIRIAAARLRHRPAWSVAYLNARLSDEQRRLTELRAGDLSVAAAFAVSFDHLADAQRSVFRLLGLHPGGDFDRHAAAALTGMTPLAAELLLEDLVDVNLLRQAVPGRYQFHDLLRSYAHTTVMAEETEEVRRAALRRLVDHYLHTADRAAQLLDPSRVHLAVDVRAEPVDPVVLGDQRAAIEWLTTELANLIAVTSLAAAHGWHGPAWQVPRSLWRFFLIRGLYSDWVATHRIALAAVVRDANPRGHAETLTNLAFAQWRGGNYAEAVTRNREALEIAEELADPVGQAKALNSLGFVYDWMGRCGAAVEHHERALLLYRELGDDWGVNRVLTGLGNAYRQLGRWTSARACLTEALEIARRSGDRWGECLSLAGLGLAFEKDEAVQHGEQAVVLAGEIGDHWIDGLARTALSDTYGHLGRAAETALHAERAKLRGRDLGDRWMEGRGALGLARACRLQGAFDTGLEHGREALRLSIAIGSPGLSCAAHNELGDLLRLAGEHAEAAEHHRAALRFAEDVGNESEERRALDGIALTTAAAC